MSLSGKVAAVTASTAGIGLACAERLLQSGAIVYVSSRKTLNVEKTVHSLQQKYGENRVFGTTCNVSDESQRKTLIQTIGNNHGKLDCLVSNHAANPYMGPFLKTPPKAFTKCIETNLNCSMFLLQESLDLLKEGDKSSVVLISSIIAKLPNSQIGAYGVSKAAMMSLVKHASPELAELGIRINGVLPGVIETDFSKALWDPKFEDYGMNMLDDFDMKRAGKPVEVANLVNFLCSDEASYITGENYNVCGGSKAD